MTPEDGEYRSELTLDETDRRILECLREDGRMSVADIARRVETSQTTVKRRIDQLVSEGGMRVVPVIEPHSIGFDECIYVGVKVATGELKTVSARFREMPEVRYVAHTTGPFDLLIEAFVESRLHMANFLIDDIGQMEGILSTDVWNVLKIVKFGYEWEVPQYFRRSGLERNVLEASNAHPSVVDGEVERKETRGTDN